eukprot:g2783.t1
MPKKALPALGGSKGRFSSVGGSIEFKVRDSGGGASASKQPELRTAHSAHMTMHEARSLTGLERWPVELVLQQFSQACDADGTLSKASFERVFTRVLMVRDDRAAALARARARSQRGGVLGRRHNGGGSGGGDGGTSLAELRQAWERRQRGEIVVARLFSILDTEGRGALSPQALASACSVLCAGSLSDRLRAAFTVHDRDGDGSLRQEEMRAFLAGVFALVYETDSGTEADVGVGWAQLADVTASAAFAALREPGAASTGGSSRGTAASSTQPGMSFAQFLRWVQGEDRDGGSMGGLAKALASLSVHPGAE